MLSTNVGTNVGHVFRSVNTIGAVESWHLATLELGVIIKIILVTEDARACRAWELLLHAVCGHGRFLKIRTPSSDGGRVAEICRLETHFLYVWFVVEPAIDRRSSKEEGRDWTRY